VHFNAGPRMRGVSNRQRGDQRHEDDADEQRDLFHIS
jgi:hypothetical protein